MNAIKMLKEKTELEGAIEENYARFSEVEDAMYGENVSETLFVELDSRRNELLEEGSKLEEELDELNKTINSLVITSPEGPSGVTVAESHYDSSIKGYKPSLGTALFKDEEGNLVEVKLRPDNLIRSKWADSFIEGHKYRWEGRPVRKRPFHNVDTEWVCFVTHIEEVIE